MDEKNVIEYYKLLIQARNFHYDNFNKWMTYYYVAIGALTVAFFNSSKEMNKYNFLVIILGFSVSVLWYLSCKGYYYWIYNWIDLLMKFEKENLLDSKESLKIYSVFSTNVFNQKSSFISLTKQLNISTTKTTMIFAFIVTMSWGYLFIDYLVTKFYAEWISNIFSKIGMLFVIYFLIVFITYISSHFIKSDLKNHTLV